MPSSCRLVTAGLATRDHFDLGQAGHAHTIECAGDAIDLHQHSAGLNVGKIHIGAGNREHPAVWLASSIVPAASLYSLTVALFTCRLELASSPWRGLYRRTRRTVTGTGKVSLTHCPLSDPARWSSSARSRPSAHADRSGRCCSSDRAMRETATCAPGARLLNSAWLGSTGTSIMVWPAWQPTQRTTAPGRP